MTLAYAATNIIHLGADLLRNELFQHIEHKVKHGGIQAEGLQDLQTHRWVGGGREGVRWKTLHLC